MSDKTIKLIMEGVEENEGHVELSLFLKELDTIRAALNCVDKDVYKRNKASLKLLVSDLKHDSPAATIISPVHAGKGLDRSDSVIDGFAEIINSVVNESIPEEINYQALESLKSLGIRTGSKLKSTTLIIKDRSFDITKSFSRTIANALERGESCVGSVEGSLEQINVHGNDKFFTIYPDIGPQKVRCIFPANLHQFAVNSIEKNVEVRGILRFRPGASFPHEIKVHDIVVQPDDSELPDFDDLLGIAKLEDDRASEVIIRELRDGWH